MFRTMVRAVSTASAILLVLGFGSGVGPVMSLRTTESTTTTTTTIDHGQPIYDSLRHLLDANPTLERKLKDLDQKINDGVRRKILEKIAAQEQERNRKLQEFYMPERECNQVIAITTPTEVNAIAQGYLDQVLGAEGGGEPDASTQALLSQASAILTGSVKYNIHAVKVCMSCAELMASGMLTDEQMMNKDRYGFGKYCAETEYGYNAVRVLSWFSLGVVVVFFLRPGLLSLYLCCFSHPLLFAYSLGFYTYNRCIRRWH